MSEEKITRLEAVASHTIKGYFEAQRELALARIAAAEARGATWEEMTIEEQDAVLFKKEFIDQPLPRDYDAEPIYIAKIITGEDIISQRGWSEEALLFACRYEGITPFALRAVKDATVTDLRFAFFSESEVVSHERHIRGLLEQGATGKHAPRPGSAEAQAIGPDEEHDPAGGDPIAHLSKLLAGGLAGKSAWLAMRTAYPGLTQRALGGLLRGLPDDDNNAQGNITRAQRTLGIKK